MKNKLNINDIARMQDDSGKDEREVALKNAVLGLRTPDDSYMFDKRLMFRLNCMSEDPRMTIDAIEGLFKLIATEL